MPNPLAIITGAGRGIGRATAIELSSRGFDCVLVARSREQLETVASEVKTKSLICPGDVTDVAFVQKTVADALATFGRLDAVVNNAGLAPAKSIEETDVETWHAVIDTNLSSAFYFAKAAWTALKASRGAIVNLGSEAIRDPFPGFLAYASAKAGVNMLTQVLHREGREHGIRAYCVAPASVETEMLRKLVTEDQVGKDKTLAPEDVAKTIAACIAGDLRFASGETIYVHKS
jgi:NAD(P)-dependent dehydrogenase (short-subunit alcohol dehydrogenase family)